MANGPLISIIIPVFNGESFLHEAISSALAQDYPNVEVVVINDGSRDGSEAVALSFGDRIRYLAQSNGGVSAALNRGISMMRGDYFSWLSHDDLYSRQKISRQLHYLQTAHLRFGTRLIAYGNVTYVDRARRFLHRTLFRPHTFPLCFSPVFLGRINGCSLLIPRQALHDAGAFNTTYRVTQDYDYWHRLSRIGYRFLRTPDADTYSRVHQSQGTLTESCVASECTDLHLRYLSEMTTDQRDELHHLGLCPRTIVHIIGEERAMPMLSAAIAPKSRCHYLFYKHLDRRWASDLSPLGGVRSPVYSSHLVFLRFLNRIKRGTRTLDHFDSQGQA